jgi:hypothetical protein
LLDSLRLAIDNYKTNGDSSGAELVNLTTRAKTLLSLRNKEDGTNLLTVIQGREKLNKLLKKGLSALQTDDENEIPNQKATEEVAFESTKTKSEKSVNVESATGLQGDITTAFENLRQQEVHTGPNQSDKPSFPNTSKNGEREMKAPPGPQVVEKASSIFKPSQAAAEAETPTVVPAFVFGATGNFLLIFMCNFHVLSDLLSIYVCKLHWNLITMFVCQVHFLLIFICNFHVSKSFSSDLHM